MASPGDMPKRLPSLPVVEVAPQNNFYGAYIGRVKLRSSNAPNAVVTIPIETFANFLDDVRAGVYDHLLELPLPEVGK